MNYEEVDDDEEINENYVIDLREDLMPVIDIMQMLAGNPFKEIDFVSQEECDEVFDDDWDDLYYTGGLSHHHLRLKQFSSLSRFFWKKRFLSDSYLSLSSFSFIHSGGIG